LKHDPGPASALVVALIIGTLYTYGGTGRLIASLILLAILVAPVDQQDSLLSGMLKYLNNLLTKGIQSGA